MPASTAAPDTGTKQKLRAGSLLLKGELNFIIKKQNQNHSSGL
jgi:hypothetical protein